MTSLVQGQDTGSNFGTNVVTASYVPETSYVHYDPITTAELPEPLGTLADGGDEGLLQSDTLAWLVGDTLNGRKASTAPRVIIPGYLVQANTSQHINVNGIPPADEDYSSWGNSALWR